MSSIFIGLISVYNQGSLLMKQRAFLVGHSGAVPPESMQIPPYVIAKGLSPVAISCMKNATPKGGLIDDTGVKLFCSKFCLEFRYLAILLSNSLVLFGDDFFVALTLVFNSKLDFLFPCHIALLC